MSLVRIDAQIRCPFCHDSVLNAPRTGCAECLAWHHTACLEEHGSCSTCGATTPLASPPTDASAFLAESCVAPKCLSLRTLNRPGRKLCARHAWNELYAITFLGALSLGLAVLIGFGVVKLYHSGEPGPWPALAILVPILLALGVVAILRHSGEKASIEAATPREPPESQPTESQPSAPPVEVRAQAKKVSS